MSPVPPKCQIRNCYFYRGFEGVEEINQRPVCEAFPKGIPTEIAYGKNTHAKVLPEQENDIVFESFTEHVEKQKRELQKGNV